MSSSATTTEPGPGEGSPAAAKQLPTGPEKVKAVRQMFDAIAGRYELVNGIVSLGMDRGWRHRCIDRLELPVGSVVLDVACGTGDLSRELDRRLLRPVGVDLSLWHARARPLARPPGPRRCPFQPVPGGGLRWRRERLRPAQRHRPRHRCSSNWPASPVPAGASRSSTSLNPRLTSCGWATASGRTTRCRLSDSALSDSAAYRYLPRSFAYLPPASRVVELLEQAGFGAVEHELLSGGISQLYIATRKYEAGTR